MLKFISIFITISALALAQFEEYPYIGVSISTQTVDIVPVGTLEKADKKSLSISYGKQSKDWRTSFKLTSTSDSLTTLSMHIDKILLDKVFGMPEIRPYIGGTMGLLYTDKFADDDDKSGYFYGADAGLIIYATDNIDIDMSGYYYKVDGLETIDKMTGANFGMHYFY